MSSLNRYKKSGGFVQLLSLIETFGPQKRDKFIEMIEAESHVWAQAIREKALTVDRIFSWPDQVAIEVLKHLPIKNMAIALEGLKEDQKARMMVFFTPSDVRRMQDAMVAKPKPEEMAANMVKVVELARKMLLDGEVRAEKFDESLLIPEDYESKLEGQGDHAYAAKVAHDVQQAANFAAAGGRGAAPGGGANGDAGKDGQGSSGGGAEVIQLQRTLAAIMKENKTLKDEVRAMRDKLEQIRKIA
jgi:hypothetical protein